MDPSTNCLNQLNEIRRRAAEVDAWSRRHWRNDELENSTRTPGWEPPMSDGQLEISVASVNDVARLRTNALMAEGIAVAPSTVPRGRFLAFDPGQSLSDGAAAAASLGFFDQDNTPPWDSWLMFIEEAPRASDRWTAFDSYLLCWIPESLVEVAARAVDVNPEQCLRWVNGLA